MTAPPAGAPEREELTFRSAGVDCAAWLYRPPAGAGAADPPCVVMAHGFSLTRHDGLSLYATRLAEAGLAVLAFDHRYLGDSDGEPRQRFRTSAQLADWRSAIDFVRTLPGVDRSRIVLWGYSFAGGHVTTLAARESAIAAALVTCPFVNGLARLMNARPAVVAWVAPRALADVLGRHTLIPVTGPEGSRAAMSFAGEGEGFARTIGSDSTWRNEISPGVFATVAFHRPLALAGRIECPLWVGLGDRDISVDGGSVVRLAERAPRGELHRFDVDHFEPFGEPAASAIASSQIEFLQRLGLAAGYQDPPPPPPENPPPPPPENPPPPPPEPEETSGAT